MRPDTKQRWLNDSRTFAPWHYDEEHMLRDTDGTLTLPTIRIKEQLQGLPGFTAVGDLPLRSRHRMLGNAWNCTVAKFLLTLILLYGQIHISDLQDSAKSASADSTSDGDDSGSSRTSWHGASTRDAFTPSFTTM